MSSMARPPAQHLFRCYQDTVSGQFAEALFECAIVPSGRGGILIFTAPGFSQLRDFHSSGIFTAPGFSQLRDFHTSEIPFPVSRLAAGGSDRPGLRFPRRLPSSGGNGCFFPSLRPAALLDALRTTPVQLAIFLSLVLSGSVMAVGVSEFVISITLAGR